MMEPLRILLITSENWNDKTYGNNVLTSWFEGFPAEFAQIYCSPGQPYNHCCKKYFQITDWMMLKSIVSRQKAGISFELDDYPTKIISGVEPENKKLYSKLKGITTETLRAIREMIWSFGRYDIYKLKKFISTFNPDIIFCPRAANIKLLRLEKIVHSIANVPIVAFTGDADYSMKLFRLSPVFWAKKLVFRRKLRKTMPIYSLYYVTSDEMKAEYAKVFRCNLKILKRCDNFAGEVPVKDVGSPIKMVYAGRLYCNRWRILAAVGKALKVINKNGVKMTLNIYAKDKLSNAQKRQLNDSKSIFFKGAVDETELNNIYATSDIALHVESFDLKNRLETRVSFSTKIIEYLKSGCAVIAICWDKHAGYTYLKKEDAALTVRNKKDILPVLEKIVDNPSLISEYAVKAWECGRRFHHKEIVQRMLYDDFAEVIENYRNKKVQI